MWVCPSWAAPRMGASSSGSRVAAPRRRRFGEGESARMGPILCRGGAGVVESRSQRQRVDPPGRGSRGGDPALPYVRRIAYLIGNPENRDVTASRDWRSFRYLPCRCSPQPPWPYSAAYGPRPATPPTSTHFLCPSSSRKSKTYQRHRMRYNGTYRPTSRQPGEVQCAKNASLRTSLGSVWTDG